MEPIIKWAGGKRQLLPILKNKLPTFNKYAEPFIGGGSLLFDILPDNAIIGDTNKELINMYRMIRDRKDELKEVLSILEITYNSFPNINNKSDLYYTERDIFNKCIVQQTYDVKKRSINDISK